MTSSITESGRDRRLPAITERGIVSWLMQNGCYIWIVAVLVLAGCGERTADQKAIDTVPPVKSNSQNVNLVAPGA
jgi:hypothetical protein